VKKLAVVITCLGLLSSGFVEAKKETKVIAPEIVAQKDMPFAKALATSFDQEIIIAQIGDFADSESFVNIPESQKLSGKDVIVVQQFLFNGLSLNDQLFKFLLLVDFVKKAGAKKIVAVVPYIAYSRQDKTFKGDYKGAIELIGKLLKTSGVDDVVTFELHAPEIKNSFALNLHEITMQQFWADFIKKELEDKQYCLISPDKGGEKRVEKVAKILGKDFGYIKKERIDVDNPKAYELVGDVKGKVVVIVDDILDTAKTAEGSCDLLIKKGAKEIFGCFTHPVLSSGSIERIEKCALQKVFITDTITVENKIKGSSKFQVLSVGNLLCDYVKKNFYGTV